MIVSSPITAPAGVVSIRNLVKRYGDVLALDDVSLEIEPGQFVTVLGPSGCGKTTLLRAIAGFVTPDAGEIALSGVPVDAWPPFRRPTTMVFQNYALFPHLTVAENVAFGLRERPRSARLPSAAISGRVDRVLSLVELEGFGRRRIGELSGGQQHRVALARALVLEPAVLLLDEPLGALDVLLRRQMQGMLKTLQRQTGITFLAVTHDQEEALTMSDRIVVMNAGRIEQDGAPDEVFQRPRTRFVAEFMGEGRRNLYPLSVLPDGTARIAGLDIDLSDDAVPSGGNGPCWAMLQPSRLRLGPPSGAGIPGGACRFETTVTDVIYRGATLSAAVAMPDGARAMADLDAGRTDIGIATSVTAWFFPADLAIVPESAPGRVADLTRTAAS